MLLYQVIVYCVLVVVSGGAAGVGVNKVRSPSVCVLHGLVCVFTGSSVAEIP